MFLEQISPEAPGGLVSGAYSAQHHSLRNSYYEMLEPQLPPPGPYQRSKNSTGASQILFDSAQAARISLLAPL